MSDDFLIAYRRARQKVGEAEWVLLSNERQENALVDELRALDAQVERGQNPRLVVGNWLRAHGLIPAGVTSVD